MPEAIAQGAKQVTLRAPRARRGLRDRFSVGRARGVPCASAVLVLALAWAPGAAGANAGAFSKFRIPTPKSIPTGITAGRDGNLWFVEHEGDKIGRITPQGAITEFAIPTPNSGPAGITAGPDGNVWFAENATDKIGRISPQ